MDMKNIIRKTVAAGASENIVVDTSNNGWSSVVHFHFATAATGDLGISVKRNSVWYGVAVQALAAEGEGIWTGNLWTNDGDTIKLSNLTGVEASVYIVQTYELSGAGSWQTIDVGETEESSSSSYSSSVSSKSSSLNSSSSDSSSSDSSTSISSNSSSVSSSSPSSSLNSSSDSSASTSSASSVSSLNSSSSDSSDSSESTDVQNSSSSSDSSNSSGPD